MEHWSTMGKNSVQLRVLGRNVLGTYIACSYFTVPISLLSHLVTEISVLEEILNTTPSKFQT